MGISKQSQSIKMVVMMMHEFINATLFLLLLYIAPEHDDEQWIVNPHHQNSALSTMRTDLRYYF